jgi:putative selenate reductase
MSTHASALRPARFEHLWAWAQDGIEHERSVFGLPRRAFWIGDPAYDLSIAAHGGRLATPVGVAAGPHTQLAQNLVVAWLAGARVLELKTVQVLDTLEIPRPCIDAPAADASVGNNVAYNVEWSQELRLGESLEQYVSAWALLHALAPQVLGAGAAAALAGTRFDASVGYDLAGIRSAPVAAFLDRLADASDLMTRMRDALPAAARAQWPQDAPSRVTDTVTLSSFHGCPPEEIERIVEHLFARHALNVVVKLNPTLLGFDAVDALLHGPLGWDHVSLDRSAFERDLQFTDAVAMLTRLQSAAARHGRTLGVKLTNTLVVHNTRGRLAGEAVYMSGAPLHPIAITLADRLAGAMSVPLPMSLSAGVNAENFADAIACGFAPATTCTDLLRPTGYRRLPRYLKALQSEMSRLGADDIDALKRARAAERGEAHVSAADAARANLTAYAAQVGSERRYAAALPPAAASMRPALELVDCDSCNQCALACPNGAISDCPSPAGAAQRERQWWVFADFCNECGNCDTWCPQEGGPYRVKTRVHVSAEAYAQDAGAHRALLEDGAVSAATGEFERRVAGQALADGTMLRALTREGAKR